MYAGDIIKKKKTPREHQKVEKTLRERISNCSGKYNTFCCLRGNGAFRKKEQRTKKCYQK